jgi:alkaline phosphatase
MTRRSFLGACGVAASAAEPLHSFTAGIVPAGRNSGTPAETYWRNCDSVSQLGFHNIDINDTRTRIDLAYRGREPEFREQMASRGLTLCGLALFSRVAEASQREETIARHLQLGRFLHATGGKYITHMLAIGEVLNEPSDSAAYAHVDVKEWASQANEIGRRLGPGTAFMGPAKRSVCARRPNRQGTLPQRQYHFILHALQRHCHLERPRLRDRMGRHGVRIWNQRRKTLMKYMTKQTVLVIAALIAAQAACVPAYSAPPAKNVILFIGDGMGVSSLSTASIYGYSRPQALYVQRMPHLALADTSTAKEWVTDAAAGATAWATGVKGRNGVVSQSAAAERDAKDGETLKTILEYAEENGISTGIIANDDRTGITIAAVAAFYSHINNRQLSGDIFEQLLNPRFGDGPDVVIGTGRKWILEQTTKSGHDIAKEVPAKGYAYLDSFAAVKTLDPAKSRLIALFDDTEFNFNEAVEQAVARLSKNPKGYLLIAFSDCHLGKSAKSLSRIVELDKAIGNATEKHKSDTLVLVTADHGYDIRVKGEALTETARTATPKQLLGAVSLEDQHTAEEVPVMADGPGSDRVHGWVANTDVFHYMMGALGFEKYRTQARYPIAGTAGWDYIAIDSASRRLYVSHETQVEVLDADSGKQVGTIGDTPGVHGTAIAHGINRGFTSNGKEDKVSMFDTETLRLIAKIAVGKGPDGIYFDAASNRVFTNNHGSHDITAIDAGTGKVAGTVKVGGDGEQAVSGGDGLIYVNLEDKGEVAVFDPKTLEVKKRFPIAGAHTPTGLAMDTKTHRLFIGCRSEVMVVMDALTGKSIARLPIGANVDAAGFDEEARMIFTSNGDGTLNIFHEKSADEYEDLGAVVTQASAKTMAFDTKTKKIFLPAAQVDVIPAEDPTKKPVRRIQPNSFGVLVTGRL